ncbi:MAG: hypothetical protein NTX63_01430 [Candidatus Peregrinibacteria bacterium]|nr:hypothetical protein [Candidatus Peregrinibacteria bacterium]
MEQTLLTLPELLKSCVSGIMATVSLEELSAEQREAFEKSVKDCVDEEVMKIVIEHLSEEDFQKLITSIEGGALTPEEEARVIDEAVAKVPDFAEKLSSALAAIHHEFTLSIASEPTSL